MKRHYKIDVYDSILTVANSKRYAETRHITYENACTSIGGKNDKWNIVIYLPKKCLRTACHESVHGAFSLLDKLSCSIDVDNQEPLAWLTDYIFSCCQDFMRRLPDG